MTANRTLIELAQAGDMKAFEALIQKYEKDIYKLCLKILQDEEEAADTFQEVCLKIWRQLKSYKGDAKLSTWIYRLTTNQCIDVLRKNKKKHKVVSFFQKEVKEVVESNHKDLKADVYEMVESKALQEIIEIGMHELKAEYRVVIVLKDIEGYSYEEISKILQISLGTVKSRLSRGRKALRKILEQDKEPYKSFFRLKK